MRIAIVLGTRPEIIKLSPILRSIEKVAGASTVLVHTNQHYDRELDALFFEELHLKAPDYNLGVGTHSHGRQTGLMLAGIEDAIIKEEPDAMVVQGDTNSTFAGALAAAKLGIPVAHVEAGLRSFDRAMPEEVNRVMTDHISTYRYAPTVRAAEHLRAEGITAGVHMVGNTVVDALFQHMAVAQGVGAAALNKGAEDYVLTTLHRDSNTDHADRLGELLNALEQVHARSGLEVLFPAHPRVLHRLECFGLLDRARNLPGVRIVEPMGYLEFLMFLKHARAVLTDSGGVQEEACILGVPAVTLRTSTERQETLEVGANVLTPTGPEAVQAICNAVSADRREWPNPFGDGTAGKRIVEHLIGDLAAVQEAS